MKSSVTHVSVLLQEVINGLDVQARETVLDATLGGGGHAQLLLQRVGASGTVIAIDADNAALIRSREHLEHTAKHYGATLFLEQSNFRYIHEVLKKIGITEVHKVLFDLGLSSQEIEESGRGFSFKRNEPLLMTFSNELRADELTAQEIVNTWDEENIAIIIKSYGEERYARRIARAIIEVRQHKTIETTFDLVEIIINATPHSYHHMKIHPATRTFQALRMTVNDEVGALKDGLLHAFEALVPDGRIAVISFHSIEDRIVKHFFKQLIVDGKAGQITKKPIIPTVEEIEENPRSRSAKLRIISKTVQ